MKSNFTKQISRAFAGLAFVALAQSASASLITNGFTFAVASDGSDNSTGEHFHSNTGGAYGNPAGKAEVGRFNDEEVRGLSEYDLTGLSNSATAFVTFNIFDDGGLFSGMNDFPFNGTIAVEAYSGNNTEDVSDYQSTTIASIGSFSTMGLGIGEILSFDVSSIYNSTIDDGINSLGMRLRADPLNENGAWTFDSFRLTTDDQSTVPVPGTMMLFVLGFLGLGWRRATRN